MKPADPSRLREFDALPAEAYVRLPTVMALFSVSASTVWRWSRTGRLAPVRVGNVTLWRVSELRRAFR